MHNSGITPQSVNPQDGPPPDAYILDEGEERSMIEKQSRHDPKLKSLIQVSPKCSIPGLHINSMLFSTRTTASTQT